MTHHVGSLGSQQGVALVVGLIFLLVMTLLGVSAVQTTTLDERMAANTRDRNLAFQAAEAALRDAERDISNAVAASARGLSGLSDFSSNCGASTTATDADDGLCYNGPGGYTTAIWQATSLSAPPSVQYGRFTGAAAIPGVAAQPRYLIEGFRRRLPGRAGSPFRYRITVRALGASPDTVVLLQSVYTP